MSLALIPARSGTMPGMDENPYQSPQSLAEALPPPPSDCKLVPARLGLVALFAVLIYVAVFWLITTIAGLYGHVLDP